MEDKYSWEGIRLGDSATDAMQPDEEDFIMAKP
jgi:hypothetical protein